MAELSEERGERKKAAILLWPLEALTPMTDCDFDFLPVSCMGCIHVVLKHFSPFPVPELNLSAFILGN